MNPFTHLVFFRFKPNALGQDAAANMAKAKKLLEALPAAIPQLKALTCGTDVSRSPASFDFGLYTLFDTEADFIVYRDHPAHQEVVAFIREVVSDRAVVDYVA